MRKKKKAPVVVKEVSEMAKRGIQMAHDLNLSPRSCCPRLFKAISDEIPEVKHNQPLSHMVRPVQQMIRDFYEGRKQKIEPGKKEWGIGGKQAESELAAYYKRQRRELYMTLTGKRFAKSIASINTKFLSAEESVKIQTRVNETIEKIVS